MKQAILFTFAPRNTWSMSGGTSTNGWLTAPATGRPTSITACCKIMAGSKTTGTGCERDNIGLKLTDLIIDEDRIIFHITFTFTTSARTIPGPPPTTPPPCPCLRFRLAFLCKGTPPTGVAAWAWPAPLSFLARRSLIRRTLPPRPRISSLAFYRTKNLVHYYFI